LTYDPSRELAQLRKELDAQSEKIRRLIEAGKNAEARAEGNKMDAMQVRKARLELAVKRFQGPV